MTYVNPLYRRKPELTISEFAEKYFNFKNNWHHILFYELLEDKVAQKEIEGKRKMSVVGVKFTYQGKYYYVPKLYHRHFLILSPRFSAKSTVFSFIYPLYLICHNPDIRILIVSANEEIATSFVRQVLYQLENNQKLLKEYGYLIPTRYKKWGEKAFIVKRDTIEKDPTFSAAGILGKIVSKRADVIILDDIIDLELARTSHQRTKVLEWFDNVLYPIMDPNIGRLIVVGTSWFKGDLYDTLFEEREFDVKLKLKSYIAKRSVRRSHINKQGNKFWGIKPKFTEFTQPLAFFPEDHFSELLILRYKNKGLLQSYKEGVLWPEKWSLEVLEKTKKKIGETAFSRQFLNEPISPIDTFFSKQSIDLAYAKGKHLPLPQQYPTTTPNFPHNLITAMGVDVALSTSKDADFSAIAIWGLKEDRTRYLLHLEKMKVPIDQLKQRIIDLYHLFSCIKVVVESNVFQDLIKTELAEEIDVEGLKTTAMNKFDEVRGLGHIQTLFDQGKIIIPNLSSNRDIVSFYQDLLSVRLEEKAHTPDTVMASWFALSFLKNYDELTSKTAGYLSPVVIGQASTKIVMPSQYTIPLTQNKLIPSYHSIFYCFIPKRNIFDIHAISKEYFIFATAFKGRIIAYFFDVYTGDMDAKIEGNISPTFFAQWLNKRKEFFHNSTIAVYKGGEGQTLLYELQKEEYPSLYVSYPKENGLPVFEVGVKECPYLISPVFTFLQYHLANARDLIIKDKKVLVDLSRIINVTGSDILTSNNEFPQNAFTFAFGYYLWYHFNRKDKKEDEKIKRSGRVKRKFTSPPYQIFNYPS